MKSILQDEKECYICGSTVWLERHHIYFSFNRKKSEQNGFVVYLCHRHHNEPPDGVHFNLDVDNELKQICQAEYEKTHSHQEFMKLIGRNYL